MGRSALLDEVVALAAERGELVRSDTAAELARDLPFGVTVDVLNEYLMLQGPHRFHRLAGEVQARPHERLGAAASGRALARVGRRGCFDGRLEARPNAGHCGDARPARVCVCLCGPRCRSAPRRDNPPVDSIPFGVSTNLEASASLGWADWTWSPMTTRSVTPSEALPSRAPQGRASRAARPADGRRAGAARGARGRLTEAASTRSAPSR